MAVATAMHPHMQHKHKLLHRLIFVDSTPTFHLDVPDLLAWRLRPWSLGIIRLLGFCMRWRTVGFC